MRPELPACAPPGVRSGGGSAGGDEKAKTEEVPAGGVEEEGTPGAEGGGTDFFAPLKKSVTLTRRPRGAGEEDW